MKKEKIQIFFINSQKSNITNQKVFFGFTLIELIIAITIISVFSVIGFTAYASILENSYNSSKVSHINNLAATIKSYSTVNDYNLPPVDGNKQYYTEDGTYAHYSTGAYGVSGFITERSIPRYNSNNIPRDPKIGTYYSYGKTLATRHTQKSQYGELNENQYQIATALNKEGIYHTYIKGDYKNSTLKTTSLVKEYNGPGMAVHNTANHLPYDPEEFKLTGQITSFSGNVIVGNTQIDTTNIQEILIKESDTIKVNIGGLATIKLGDGSELKVGSQTKNTEVVFKDLHYKQETNLITKTIIQLSFGEIWVKAPELEQDSEYTLQTETAAASVRGTVFGMEYDNLSRKGNIGLISGKVEMVMSNSASENDFIRGEYGGYLGFSEVSMINNVGMNGRLSKLRVGRNKFRYFMSVKDSEKPISVNFRNYDAGSFKELKIIGDYDTPIKTIQQVNSEQVSLKESYIPTITSVRKDSSGSLFITTDARDANYYEAVGIVDMEDGEGVIFTGKILTTSGTINTEQEIMIGGTGAFDEEDSSIVSLRLCKTNEDNINMNNQSILSSKILQLQDQLITKDFIKSLWDRSVYYETTLKDRHVISNVADLNGSPTGGTVPQKQFQVICSYFSVPLVFKGDRFSTETSCPPGQSISPLTRQCEEPGLVAFAGYDEAYDVDTTTHHLKWLKPEEGERFNAIQDVEGFINSQSGSEIGSGVYNLSNYVGGTENYLIGGAYKGCISKFKNGINGVYVQNGNTGNYIKYDLGKLQLGDKFGIEVNVRGGALKRTASNFYLFSFSDGGIIFNNNSVGFGLSFGHLKSVAGSARIPAGLIDNIGSYISDETKFYKLKFSFDLTSNGNEKVEVLIDNFYKSLPITITGPDTILDPPNKYLNIGGPNDNVLQRNDIIDYVKIYKY